ncbi:MAG: hypothetical protein ACI9N1_001953 [Flavobacteriales bacterium]|jgi:hypothetical protein
MKIAIGPIVITVLIAVIAIFLLGYFLGKKSGYIKRLKETENQNRNIN